MNKERNCECAVCIVEQNLLDSLRTKTAQDHFNALGRTNPVFNHVHSPLDAVARLHEQGETVNRAAGNEILHSLIRAIADPTSEDIGQQMLLVAFTPAIHRSRTGNCSADP
jgi:hypothetical protein